MSPLWVRQVSEPTGMVSLSPQVVGSDPSERAPFRIPFPLKVPVPETDWLFLIVWLSVPVKPSARAGLEESNCPIPSNTALPSPAK